MSGKARSPASILRRAVFQPGLLSGIGAVRTPTHFLLTKPTRHLQWVRELARSGQRGAVRALTIRGRPLRWAGGEQVLLRAENPQLLAGCRRGIDTQLGDRLTHMLLITVIALSNPGRLLAYSTSSMVFVLPSLLIAPIAGVLVDRWDKRRVLGRTHIIQSSLLFVSAFLVIATGSFIPFWIALFIFFGLDVFNNTSIPALIPELVPEGDLLAANSANLTFNRVATVLGMVIGGFLVRWAGWRYGMIINSATHLTAGLLALLITGTYVAHRVIRPASPSPFPAKVKASEGMGTQPAADDGAWNLVAQAFRQLFADIAEVARVVGRNRLVAFVMASRSSRLSSPRCRTRS